MFALEERVDGQLHVASGATIPRPRVVDAPLHSLAHDFVTEVTEHAAEAFLAPTVAGLGRLPFLVPGDVDVHAHGLGPVARGELAQYVVAHAVPTVERDVVSVDEDADASIGEGDGHGGFLRMIRFDWTQ